MPGVSNTIHIMTYVDACCIPSSQAPSNNQEATTQVLVVADVLCWTQIVIKSLEAAFVHVFAQVLWPL
jgi:hypothetical protein